MIVACKHKADGQLVPCPPMCGRQDWPRFYFRLTFFRSRWKLRRRYRHFEAEWDARSAAMTAQDRP